MDELLKKALEQFKESMKVISENWDDNLDNKYPFEKSFDGLLLDVIEWCDQEG
ncbi:MAG: hypothetical protein K6T85_19050 [Gorillibacterium sp.]|nr:hypothetical protein [Gorillibacterium sp.]